MELQRTGFVLGTGAITNVELGFIPDRVELINLTDGDTLNIGFVSTKVIAFTSGGTTELVAGMKIKGVTSKTTAIVKAVFLTSGTFAAGTAAGFIVIDAESESGAFGSENAFIVTTDIVGATGDDLTVAVSANWGVAILLATAGAVTLSAYKGVAGSNARGFTMSAALSESGKVFAYTASRNLL